MESPEILVHISAPSGAADDARYRAQVDAILGFQTVSRQSISTAAADEGSYSISHFRNSPTAPSTGFSSAEQAKHRNPSDKAGSIGSLHLSTDRPVTAGNANEDDPVEHASIPRSRAVPSAPAVTSPIYTPSQKRPESDFGTPVSVIPDSQPEQVHPGTEAVQHPGPQPSGSAKRRRVESPTPKGPNTLPSEPAAQQRPTNETEISDVPETNTTTPASTTNQTPYIPLTTLPLKIHPPPPATSTRPFKTHLTPALSMLAKRLSLPRIYKPIHQTRDLNTLERGHWFLRINIHSHQSPQSPNPHPNTWDMSIFTRFWTFLSDFISKEGRAGWGVWCILEEGVTVTDRVDSSAMSPPVVTEGSEGIEGIKPLTLKVYTWGEIASHVYLLLFLASERRIKKMGAQWKDGAEEVVVQM